MDACSSECPRDHPMYRTIKPNRPTNQYTVVLIAPFVFMIVSFAAFQSGQNLVDLGALMELTWHSPEMF